MLKPPYSSLLLLILISLLNACKPRPKLIEAESGSANFSSMAYIGGNYFSGYQDGALFREAQEFSIPSLLSKQIELINNTPVNTALLDQTTFIGLTFKGDPYQSRFHLEHKFDCKGETSLKPANNPIAFQTALSLRKGFTSYNNLSVPYAGIKDLFDPKFGEEPSFNKPNPFYYALASNPGISTVMYDYEKLNPTFSTIWIGMEDIYNYAMKGGNGIAITEPDVFENHLNEILKKASLNQAKGVLANIPDIHHFPFYTLIPSLSIDLTKNQSDSLNLSLQGYFEYHEGKNGFQIEDESMENFPYRLSETGEYILLNTPLDSVKCHKMGLFYPLPNRYILDKKEIAFIQSQIRIYNEIIKRKAMEYDFAFVDMNYYFNTISSKISVDGVSYSTEFVSGGFFSLDGFHPNQKGYALLTNKFIEAINLKYSSTIPTVYCKNCSGVKFP